MRRLLDILQAVWDAEVKLMEGAAYALCRWWACTRGKHELGHLYIKDDWPNGVLTAQDCQYCPYVKYAVGIDPAS
ncbi:hypothetical protein KITKAT_7 [Arthrobacter phage Kitkat]|uniref:Uncharacterized protein n=1 Tax=Arthrobacter phage Kitkat TaxID=1796996 RepID=A0A140G6I7_9CAUD|nr:hypothetical protein BJD77_gp007 [Arthrobacter phage Kitkat]AMM44272.1 hypothetical protein KITKAT_7 [Arthrobacter phage Kitkat]